MTQYIVVRNVRGDGVALKQQFLYRLACNAHAKMFDFLGSVCKGIRKYNGIVQHKLPKRICSPFDVPRPWHTESTACTWSVTCKREKNRNLTKTTLNNHNSLLNTSKTTPDKKTTHKICCVVNRNSFCDLALSICPAKSAKQLRTNCTLHGARLDKE